MREKVSQRTEERREKCFSCRFASRKRASERERTSVSCPLRSALLRFSSSLADERPRRASASPRAFASCCEPLRSSRRLASRRSAACAPSAPSARRSALVDRQERNQHTTKTSQYYE